MDDPDRIVVHGHEVGPPTRRGGGRRDPERGGERGIGGALPGEQPAREPVLAQKRLHDDDAIVGRHPTSVQRDACYDCSPMARTKPSAPSILKLGLPAGSLKDMT